jgi:trypsin
MNDRKAAGDSEFIYISKEVIHPKYDDLDYPYDIMLLKLNAKSDKKYLKLERGEPDDGEELTVIGFGDTVKGAGQVIPKKLQEVDLDYVTNSYCSAIHGNDMITDDMLCAFASGQDSW